MALPSPSAGTEQLGCHIRAAPFPFLRAVPADCSPCCLRSRLHVVLHTRCFVGHFLPPHGPPEPGRARGFGRSFHPMASCCSRVSAESSLSPDFHAPRPFTEDPQWQLRPRVSAVSGQLRAGPCASCLLLGRIASLVRLRWAAGTAGVGLRAAAASCLLFCRHRFCVSQSGFGPCSSMLSPLAVSSLAQGQGGFVDTEFDPSVFRSYTLPAALSRVRRPGPSL